MIKILLVLAAALGMVSNIFTKNPDIKIHASNVPVAVTDTLKKDVQTGLIEDENLYMVKAQCTSCHSSKLILQNRFTRDGWKQKIRWMQAKHNLWELGDTEKQVLDYLEKHYAPTASVARRAPLKDIKWYKLEQK
jgi:hypothetical protein